VPFKHISNHIQSLNLTQYLNEDETSPVTSNMLHIWNEERPSSLHATTENPVASILIKDTSSSHSTATENLVNLESTLSVEDDKASPFSLTTQNTLTSKSIQDLHEDVLMNDLNSSEDADDDNEKVETATDFDPEDSNEYFERS
jgi:hypothetical protein